MNSYLMAGPARRDQLVKMLDDLKASVLERFDAGEAVAVHTHNELLPVDYDGLTGDFLWTGWTFGVSFGEFPRRTKVSHS